MNGYVTHYGTASGVYSQGIDVGNTTSHTVSNLYSGQTYYFATTTYNHAGQQSVYSNEVTFNEVTFRDPSITDKAITAFNFNTLSPAVIGAVDEGAKTVALTVPFGTNVIALVPTITHTGASVNLASGASQNFTNPATYTVTAADSTTQAYVVTVTQVQIGSVIINPEPAAMNSTAPWTLTGPNNYIQTGIGDQTLNNLTAGNYTITWGAVTGWTSPAQATNALPSGGTTTFIGTYVQQTGTIIINLGPNSVTAPWTLTGPNSFSRTGTGNQTLNNLTAGNYTITWGAVTGWTSPAQATQVLTNGGMIAFNGTYVYQTIPDIQVTPIRLYFGYVPVGSTKDLFLTVKNTSDGTLTGNATTEAPFSIVSGGSYSLAPAKEQTVMIRYQPPSAGTHTGTVVLTGGAGVNVPVNGKTEKPLGLPWLTLLLEN